MAAWHPRPEDMHRVFEEQNPWHRGACVPTILAPPVERPLAQHMWRAVLARESRRFQLILGPRRVGKTTVMYQTVRHLLDAGLAPHRIWWLRLDHPLLLRESLDDLARAVIRTSGATVADPAVLLMDEIVYAKDWDLWLKTFYDDLWPVRVLATSSATAALRDRHLESGVGRWSDQYLAPYLFTEYLDLAGVPADLPTGQHLAETLAHLPRHLPEAAAVERLRRRFLLVGGFPELLVTMPVDDLDNRDQMLRSQQVLRGDAVERAIYKDIPQSLGVDNPMMLERLLYVLASQIAGVLSPASICGELGGLSQPTFDRYLSYLERAFLVFTLNNYSGKETSVQRRGRKLYFLDGAIRNAALQRGLAPLDQPDELGLLIENLVAASLHSLAVHSGVRLFHWRDGKHEVDLVLDHPQAPLAFEVGMSADHSRKGLIKLVERYPRFAGRAYLISPRATVMAPGEHPSGIGTIPLDTFLIAVGRQGEAAMMQRLPTVDQ